MNNLGCMLDIWTSPDISAGREMLVMPLQDNRTTHDCGIVCRYVVLFSPASCHANHTPPLTFTIGYCGICNKDFRKHFVSHQSMKLFVRRTNSVDGYCFCSQGCRVQAAADASLVTERTQEHLTMGSSRTVELIHPSYVQDSCPKHGRY